VANGQNAEGLVPVFEAQVLAVDEIERLVEMLPVDPRLDDQIMAATEDGHWSIADAWTCTPDSVSGK
jgi:hypothetical protein